MFQKHNNTNKAFTLIELLVVIAIIGVLASVVLASLNTTREKGKIASIKSNLKNMIPQAELAYDTPGNYSTVCAGVQKMMDAITGAGGTASCYSYDNTRWGVSVMNGASTPIQAYSVSPNGVTVWQAQGVNYSGVSTTPDITMNWTNANTSCATAGGRLPTLEELRALSLVSYNISGSYMPPGFNITATPYYWSSTTLSTDPISAFVVGMVSGNISSNNKTSGYHNVRCVSSI